ncbi:hypothetical protein [Mucilaginibacter gilvus]|uniref:Uncharacterized protein n=1 Tax=Mucilaginibacter gilvus TaxID=2305909 RepID=A0A444MUG1_9SPHI|nr:hypothetical protein [Mucilaginibacter gilvus]RWY57237.1 hypothetical protein EPL05_01505 [Mucilaginibacter gilvus]
MDSYQRKTRADEPIIWTGDLLDDCTAEWCGLMLRAEWMDEDYWWWRVYDIQKGGAIINDSNSTDERFISGEASRKTAECVAKQYISTISAKMAGTFVIAETFKITGRGLVFAGYIKEGTPLVGNTIEFVTPYYIWHRKIAGVEAVLNPSANKINTGLLIECKNEHEINELREWNPANQTAVVFEEIEERVNQNYNMDEGLKNKAYLEGSKLKKAGYDNEVIRSRLDKMGIPEDLIVQVIKNLSIQQQIDAVSEQTPFYNVALIRVGIGVALAIISYVLVPGVVILPIGLIGGGIASAYLAKSKM